MADTNIEKLSKLFKTPLERLLSQIEEAGISGKTASSTISSTEKQQLMKFITQKHKNNDSTEETKNTVEKEPVKIKVINPKKRVPKKEQ